MQWNIGVVSYSLTCLLFLILCFLLFFRWRKRVGGLWFILFCLVTALWAGFTAYAASSNSPVNFNLILIELFRDYIWALLLLKFINMQRFPEEQLGRGLYWIGVAAYAAPLVLIVLLLSIKWSGQFLPVLGFDLRILGHVVIAILGLSLIEQIFRFEKVEQRWAIKFLCFGIGSFYVFDFFLYSDALLFKEMNTNFWYARGIVYALATPLIFIAVARNPVINSNIAVSRSVVFYTTVIMLAGFYLIVMATGGYYLKAFGGDWGEIALISFVFAAILGFLIIVFSGHMRARLRVFIDKHFLEYKYDYREQWLGLMRKLSVVDDNSNLQERALSAFFGIMNCSSGSLWVRQNKDNFVPVVQIDMSDVEGIKENTKNSLAQYLENWQWVINMDEYRSDPGLYNDLHVPKWMGENKNIWLVIPLMLQYKLYGFVVLNRPTTETSFNWEDIDVLKTTGRQVAIHLAQERSAMALVQARQFEAFNRLSAYVVHDLKNLVSQLALIVRNAEKHKHNPEFMDDAISTVDNAVERMNRLLAQLRTNALTEPSKQRVELQPLLEEVVKEKSTGTPKPQLNIGTDGVCVMGDGERLSTIVGHIIQNAQDATNGNGQVIIELSQNDDSAKIVIRDTGKGMDSDFIKNRLFKPFDTTKGLTGMGIGAHESKAYVEEMGGELRVRSELGIGSEFSITLPIYQSGLNS